ncbi:TRAP transporter small permease subunit [uncultured Jannaschia sp.]|uniref:TRAP transporter small permease n=1 Tax=uncultured Jannaschia sp. TaxID=293347 RepID=UPI00263237A7|nr:TRAP transporter small permease subunit [uncultured Jannaschia sp.]
MSEVTQMTDRRGAAVRVIDTIARTSTLLNRLAAGIAACLLVLMTLHILLEIGMRFFDRSTFMADALVGYGVAAITFLALAWALEEGSMIRVSVLTQTLPPQAALAADHFASLATLTLTLFLASHQWQSVAKLWARGSTSQHYLPIPLWIPEAIFLAGLVLLALQLVARILKRLSGQGGPDDSSLRL